MWIRYEIPRQSTRAAHTKRTRSSRSRSTPISVPQTPVRNLVSPHHAATRPTWQHLGARMAGAELLKMSLNGHVFSGRRRNCVDCTALLGSGSRRPSARDGLGRRSRCDQTFALPRPPVPQGQQRKSKRRRGSTHTTKDQGDAFVAVIVVVAQAAA
jgi:hypothetical protein